MSKLRTFTTVLATFALLGGAAGAPQALASHSQITFFEGSSELLEPASRPKVIGQLQSLGVKALRVELAWANVAPGPESATSPSFDATNPASYSWGQYDALIAEANRLHWPVLLTVTSPVPRWATSNERAPYITRPSQKDFQEFMTAVGRHYGSQVSLYAIWNEPNHPAFLLPQWTSKGAPASPRIYRGLFQAGYEGLKAGGIAHPRVLFGETAPTGYTTVNVRREKSKALLHDVAPLAFLRSALCLTPKYKRAGTCSALSVAGYAHHAYTLPAGPHYVSSQPDSVTLGSLSRLSRALDLAARAHAINSHVSIYLTEFGVQSKPNKQLGVSVSKQAEFDAIAEHIAYANARVAAFSQYLLRDDPLGGAPGSSVHGGTVGFQTGLEYASGARKPLYFGWPVPLTVSRTRHGSELWGLVRPTAGATKVTVLVRLKGSKSYRTFKTITTNGAGYWGLNTSTRGQLWRVRWVSPAGIKYEGPPIAG